MSAPRIPIHLLGQQPQAQSQFNPIQYFLTIYAQLIPVIAAGRLGGDYAEPISPDAIVEEAEAIAKAALKRLGVEISPEGKT